MHDNIKELLSAFVLGELSENGSRDVTAHLAQCRHCRQEVQRLRKIVSCTEDLKTVQADPKTYAAALRAVMAAVRREQTQEVPTAEKRFLIPLFHGRITQFAAAAAIAVIIILGVNLAQKQPEVAWGKLAERLEKIPAYSYKIHTTFPRPDGAGIVTHGYSKIYYAANRGIRIERDYNLFTVIVTVANGFQTTIYPEIKKYMRWEVSEDDLADLKEVFDPVVRMKNMLALRYKNLGKEKYDDIEVEGIEVTDGRFEREYLDRCTARLWVSVKTGLPVNFEINGTARNGNIEVTAQFTSFEWNAQLDARVFEPEIKAGYTLTAQVGKLPISEKTTLEFLRNFAGINNGRYPQSLAEFSIGQEFFIIYTRKADEKHGPQRGRFYFEEEDFAWKEFALLNAQKTRASAFYGKLAREGKDAAYYGDRVSPAMADKPLLRWKVSDTEYRVIWGDLHVTNIPAQKLAEAEMSLLK
jgi:outer membrane lipoprotein-sorting protein